MSNFEVFVILLDIALSPLLLYAGFKLGVYLRKREYKKGEDKLWKGD